jgi:hypothetical protein
MTAGDDSPQDVGVQLIEVGLWQSAIAYIAKTYGTEFNRPQQLQRNEDYSWRRAVMGSILVARRAGA